MSLETYNIFILKHKCNIDSFVLFVPCFVLRWAFQSIVTFNWSFVSEC